VLGLASAEVNQKQQYTTLRGISMKLILTILAMSMAMSILAMGQTNNKKVKEEIMKLRKEVDQAMDKADVATLERLTTDDFMITYLIPAKVFTKAELREMSKNPGGRGFTVESSTEDDVKVRVYDGAAIVTGLIKELRKRPDGSTSNFEGRFTDVWVKQRGKWLVAARHASPAFGVLKRE
jgi:ketosteroid isomerase-like protein